MFRRSTLMVVAVIASVVFASVSIVSFTRSERGRRDATAERRIANAESMLIQCQQIEAVKTALRGTLQASLRALPAASYYKTRPDELATALKATHLSIVRFARNDCYALPTVRNSGLRPPGL